MTQFEESALRQGPSQPGRLSTVEARTAVVGSETSPAMARGLVPERCAWSVVWFGVMASAFGTWGTWSVSTSMTVLALLLVAASIGGVAASWLSKSPRSRGFQLLSLSAVIVSVLVQWYGVLHTSQFYPTDSAAFDHVATVGLLHGRDPYSITMSGARALLDVPAQYWTYTVTGGYVNNVSYPAGSFLVVAPFMLLGFHHLIVDWVDLLAGLATGVLIFFLLPRPLRWLTGLLVFTPLLSGIFTSAGTDATFVPFLVLAMWRWDRYGRGRQAGLASWVGPVALGLACAIKQSPWFCVPFLVVGVAIEARRHGCSPLRTASRYAGTVVAVFAAVNLPFIVWNAGSWLHGTFTPLVAPMIADGQGLVSLAVHGVVRGVDLSYLTVCSAFVYLAVLALFVGEYPRMKRIWLVALPLALFVAPRSLSSYLEDFLPAALVGAITVEAVLQDSSRINLMRHVRVARRTLANSLCVLCAVAAAVVGVVAFTKPALELQVRGVVKGSGGATLNALTVSIRNLTDRPQVPHVMVTMGTHPSGFWLPKSGHMQAVGPDSQTTVTLYPPTVTYTALRGQEWVVSAYTLKPRSLNTSAVQVGTRPPSR
jgi:uncharacterized membrane protein